ncbi:MAG: TolC family protein [Bacteroidota bacterium]
MRSCILIFLFGSLLFFLPTTGTTQTADTTEVFTFSDYLEWVRTYHPMARRADLLNRQAEANQLAARGGFDPKLSADIDRKSFDGKRYFTVGEGALKIPSWFGAEFKMGYLWSDGIFLNPENNLPINGQAVIGVKWSLGQGLFIDERRTALQQARLLSQRNEAERRSMVNNLLLDASKSYWDWSFSVASLRIIEEAVRLAEQRFEAVRESYIQGASPAVDTLESFLQVQNRRQQQQEAVLVVTNTRQRLSNFLWYKNEIPLEVGLTLEPENLEIWNPNIPPGTLSTPTQELLMSHPDLQSYRFQLEQQQVDRRLKAEELKPRLDVEYNLLANQFDFANRSNGSSDASWWNAVWTENYKLGVSFEFPLFLRKERGKLQQADLKIRDTNFKYLNKRQELATYLDVYRQQLFNVQQQINLGRDMVVNYERLLEAETEKFRIGESSIFLLNSREQKLIESQTKVLKLKAHFQKLDAGYQWAAGTL